MSVFLPLVTDDVEISLPSFSNLNLSKCTFLYLSVAEVTNDRVLSALVASDPDKFLEKTNGAQVDMAKYFTYQNKILQQADKEFWNILVSSSSFFSSSAPDLYEFADFVPYDKHRRYTDIIDFQSELISWYNIISQIIRYELITSYMYEPYFFFREKLEQTLDEFRLVCFARQRAALLEDWIYMSTIKWNDSKADIPVFSHLANKAEAKSALKIYKRFFSYQNSHLLSYYLFFDDVQTLAIDKWFIHIWNYWLGAQNDLNIYSEEGLVGYINFLWEKIFTPITHVKSRFYWENYGYNSEATRLMQFVFFPDTVMMWGHMNVSLDTFSNPYEWFFHFGDNYIDSLQSLDYVRYQLTANYWGEFDSLVEDYTAYQPTYISDSYSAVWLPIIMLLTKEYPNPRTMDIFINDYNTAFQFKQIDRFKELLWAKELFLLTPEQRLARFRDPQTIDYHLHGFEKVLVLYFGYNYSQSITNQPNWMLDFLNVNFFYGAVQYDADEDREFETNFIRLVTSLTKYNYDYKSNVPFYFWNLHTVFDLGTLFKYFNEKIYDNYGFIWTAIERVDAANNLEIFSWMDNNSLFYVEYLPTNHYSWRFLIFNRFFFEFNIGEFSLFDGWLDFIFFKIVDSLDFELFDENAYTVADLQKKIFFFTIHTDILLEYPITAFLNYINFYANIFYNYLGKSFNFPNFPNFPNFHKNLLNTFLELISKDPLGLSEKLTHFHKIILVFFDRFSFLKDSLFPIYYNTFYYQVPEILIDWISNEHFPYEIYTVAYVWIHYIPLPTAFFIPYFFDLGLSPNYFTVRDFDCSSLYSPILPNGIRVDPQNFFQIMDFILYGAVLEIHNKWNFDYFLQPTVHVLNRMDWKDITYDSLEYKRYLNYVVKNKCYKQ